MNVHVNHREIEGKVVEFVGNALEPHHLITTNKNINYFTYENSKTERERPQNMNILMR